MATSVIVRTRRDRGQAVIELALTLPLLLIIVMGVFDFGLMFQRYEVVTNAAREGARIGVLPAYGVAAADDRALDYLASGGITGTPRACGGTVTAGTFCASAVAGTTPISGTSPVVSVPTVTVTVEYDHAHAFVGSIVNLLFGGSMGTVRLRAVSVMRTEPS